MHKKTNLTSFALLSLHLCTALVFVLFSGSIANAAIKYWIGAGAGNFNNNTRWSLSSGGPNNTTAPGAADLATFNGSGLGDDTITADPNVGGINILAGYTGTNTKNTGITLTIGPQHYAPAGGTFIYAGDLLYSIAGSFPISASDMIQHACNFAVFDAATRSTWSWLGVLLTLISGLCLFSRISRMGTAATDVSAMYAHIIRRLLGDGKSSLTPTAMNGAILRAGRALTAVLCLQLLNLLAAGPAAAAITAATLTADVGNTTNGANYATASITPTANNLVLAWVTNTKASTPDTPTLSGNGLTWVQVATVTWGTIATPTARTTLFRAMGAAPSTGGVTISFGGLAQTGAAWSIVQFNGVDTSGTNGSGAIVQSVTGRTDNASAAAGLSITLAALGNAANASAGGFSNMVNLATSISAGAGYTVSAGASYATPTTSIRSEWRIPGATTVSVTQSAISNIGGIAVEVKADLCPGNVVTTTTDSGEGSLRECINKANANAGTTISFSIPGPGNQSSGGDSWWRISPTSALPTITANGTIIDGTTQTTNQGNTNSLGPEIEIYSNSSPAFSGLTINSANNTIKGLTIGGFTATFSFRAGIYINGAGATGNTISGNYIGTNATGTSANGNYYGIFLGTSAHSNIIGGTTAAERNVIAGSTEYGILISGTNSHTIKGNYIGLNATGTAGIGNGKAGIEISGGASSTIGGTNAADRNVISGNNIAGIGMDGAGATGNTVAGNYIGINAAGTAAIGNSRGIWISGGVNNTVGGVIAGSRNIISGNSGAGLIINNSASGNMVYNNYIGTDTAGTAGIANTSHGVQLQFSAVNNIIGGTGANQPNVIAFNTSDGVWVESAGSDGNIISGNSIFSNSGLGIDLDPNGVGTGSGANNDKPRPSITSITLSGANFITVATVTASDTIEFFRVNNAAAPAVSGDPSGSGEGYLYLGKCVDNGACSGPHISAVADANAAAGTVQATLLSSGLGGPDTVSATATDATNGTSEFAVNVPTSLCPGGVVTSTADTGAGSLRECIKFANSNPGTTISFNIATAANQSSGGDSWWRISPASTLPTITAAGTVINGATQTTNQGNTNSLGPEIEIYGAGAGASVDGLTLTGGTSTIRGLVINSFTNNGIKLDVNDGNTIVGNYIGTDATGTVDLGNTYYGIYIYWHSGSNIIGTSAAADRNVISGNNSAGIRTQWSDGNIIKSNYVGVNATGTGAIGNSASGVVIYSREATGGNVIGGSGANEGNVISGNTEYGIHLDTGPINDIIQGNKIGTNAAGTAAVANTDSGIYCGTSSTGIQIGGTAAGAGNVISGNSRNGIYFQGSSSSIQGNYIGTNTGATLNLGNAGGFSGIRIDSTGSNNTIGGTATGAANVIAFNGTDGGVYIPAATADNNVISGNSIFSNAGLGIDLGPWGVGTGSGANNDKPRPTITGITPSGANFTTIATVTTGDTIEFFRVNNTASPAVTPDPTSSGEGFLYLGSCVDNGACSGPHMSAVADANAAAGTVQATLLSSGLTGADSVTATATDATNGTSEFAANVPTSLCPGGAVTTTSDSGAGSLRECIHYANANPGTAISFNIPGPGNQSSGGDSWWRITLNSCLPPITAASTVIDGSTQRVNRGVNSNSRGPEIEIDGNQGSVASCSGLEVNNVGSVRIRELAISNFSWYGVWIHGAGATNCGVYANYIGIDAVGVAARANAEQGIRVGQGVSNLDIGSAVSGDGNLVSGNGSDGIYVGNAPSSSQIRIRGNIVGINRAGTAKVPNGSTNISLSDVDFLTIGGMLVTERNIISGASFGIQMNGVVSNVTVKGNYFGTGPLGTETTLGNSSMGIYINVSPNPHNIAIGGLINGEGNLIASNPSGMVTASSGTGTQILGNILRNNTTVGISANSPSMVISGNLLQANGAANGAIRVLNTNAKIYHNTIHGSSGDGIKLEASGTGAIIKNNIITGSVNYGINRVAASMTEGHNLVTDAATSPANGFGRSNVALAISDRNLDPKYVNTASGNFALTECSSPAINSGVNLGVDQPDMNGVGAGNWTGFLPDMGAFESSCSGANDIAIGGGFSDWDNGSGNEFCLNDQGGADDWTSPAKLDITKYCIGSNLSDRFFVLFGFDDPSFANDATSCVLLDTDATPDNNINKAFCVTVNGSSVSSLTLFNCDNSIAGGCGGSTVAKTYNPADYAIGTVTGPFGGSDTFVEAQLPYADLGVALGNIVFTSLVSYPGAALLKSPKDSIFGTGGKQNYNDRIQYDTAGIGAAQNNGSIPSVSGNVYTDEGITSIGPGKTVRLLRMGADGGSNSTDAGGGYYIQNASLAAGETILVYVDNDGTYKGTTASVFPGNHLSELNIFTAHLIVRHDNAGSSTNALLNAAKGASADADILFTLSGSDLTVTGSGTELYLPDTHSFSPGGIVTTPHLKSLGTLSGGSSTFDINGNLTIAGGSYTASSASTSVSGSLSLTGGSFAHNTGTLNLDGTGQTLTGSFTFNNLTKSVASADTLTFAAGSTTTVNGTCTLNGAAGQLLAMRSSSSPSKWNLVLGASSTKAISFVDVKDSDASGSAAAKLPVNPASSFDSGATVAWFGTPMLTVIKSADTANANPGQVITYTVQVSNTGNGAALNVVLDDHLSPFSAWSLDAFGAATAFEFTDGVPASGLTLGTASYSNNDGGSWVYSPVSTGGGAPAGYDGNVTNWKMPMTGNMNAGGTFTLRYKVRVK